MPFVLLSVPLLLLAAWGVLLAVALRRVRPPERRVRAAAAAWLAVTATGALAIVGAQWSELAPSDPGAAWVGLAALGVLALPALVCRLALRARGSTELRGARRGGALGAVIALAGSAVAALLGMFAGGPDHWLRSQLLLQALPTSYAACALAVRAAATSARQTPAK